MALELLFGSPKSGPAEIWQDREIRFDTSPSDLDLCKGEDVIQCIDPVEDTKGNNGNQGLLQVTSLRLTWWSKKVKRTNISIGFNCVTALKVCSAESRLKGRRSILPPHTQLNPALCRRGMAHRMLHDCMFLCACRVLLPAGSSEALFVSAKYHSQRFEFIFTSLATNASQLFSVVQAVNTAYNTSRLYRELKLRGSCPHKPCPGIPTHLPSLLGMDQAHQWLVCALIADRELRLLPQEQTYSRVNGVWNLSSEQGNLGTFFISNVRVVWYANLADSFNVSIPYLQEVPGVWNMVQMKSIKLRDSKFGTALVIETTPWSGGYMLGFKVDPKETLDYVHKELSSLWATYSQRPIFGVEADLSPDLPTPDMAALRITSQEEDVTIVEASDKGDVLAAYYADPTKHVMADDWLMHEQGVDREPVFCPELGLAVEALKEGLTVEQLWSVL
ncbi:hypothetical protein QJQ45_015098 [Haematococcus lacustris]|nr:hypothetical protein QJQ45_015098 [Haematococcus lacustris]